MASITSAFVLPLSLLLISVSLASARPGLSFHPCNTLIVSTYSFSFLPQNPNPNPQSQFILFSADLRPYRHHHFRHRRFMVNPISISDKSQLIETPKERPEFSEFSPLGFSSLKDRTKDILSVVASLLFGAACGALTAGTMYLVWSLFNHRNECYRSMDGFNSDDDDEDNDDDDIFNPKKKAGYVAIPAAPAKVVDSAPPAHVKESA